MRPSRTLRHGGARFHKPAYAELGWVYIARAGHRVKIGFATQPVARLTNYASVAYHPLTVLACIRGTKRLERELHEWFAKYNLLGGRNEWFEPAPDLLAFAEALGVHGIHFGETFGPRCHAETLNARASAVETDVRPARPDHAAEQY